MITLHTQIEQLASIRDEWNHLLAQTPDATFFHSLEWLEVYWKHYGADQQLRVLTISKAGQLTGIVPLVIRTEKTKLGGLRYLTFPLDYWGSFYSAIGPDPYAALAEAMEYLNQAKREWDLLELRWLGRHETDCQQTADALVAAGNAPVPCLFDQAAYITLPATAEEYFASRTSKWRNNLKRWQRRTAELGEITYQRYRPEGGADGDPRWDLFDTCVSIAESSWQNSSPDGTTLSHDSIQSFLRDAHAAAAARGCVDLNLMYIDGKPVAFGYNYYYNHRIFGMRIGHHPEVRAVGAGNVLYAHMISDACQRGDRHFDLGPGSLDCKRQIWTGVLPIYRLSCYQKYSVRQQLMRMKRQWDAKDDATSQPLGVK